jgi:hypothetical protein
MTEVVLDSDEEKETPAETGGVLAFDWSAIHTLEDIFYVVEGMPKTIVEIIAMKRKLGKQWHDLVRQGRILGTKNLSDREKMLQVFAAKRRDLIPNLAVRSGLPPLTTVRMEKIETLSVAAIGDAIKAAGLRFARKVLMPRLRSVSIVSGPDETTEYDIADYMQSHEFEFLQGCFVSKAQAFTYSVIRNLRMSYESTTKFSKQISYLWDDCEHSASTCYYGNFSFVHQLNRVKAVVGVNEKLRKVFSGAANSPFTTLSGASNWGNLQVMRVTEMYVLKLEKACPTARVNDGLRRLWFSNWNRGSQNGEMSMYNVSSLATRLDGYCRATHEANVKSGVFPLEPDQDGNWDNMNSDVAAKYLKMVGETDANFQVLFSDQVRAGAGHVFLFLTKHCLRNRMVGIPFNNSSSAGPLYEDEAHQIRSMDEVINSMSILLGLAGGIGHKRLTPNFAPSMTPDERIQAIIDTYSVFELKAKAEVYVASKEIVRNIMVGTYSAQIPQQLFMQTTTRFDHHSLNDPEGSNVMRTNWTGAGMHNFFRYAYHRSLDDPDKMSIFYGMDNTYVFGPSVGEGYFCISFDGAKAEAQMTPLLMYAFQLRRARQLGYKSRLVDKGGIAAFMEEQNEPIGWLRYMFQMYPAMSGDVRAVYRTSQFYYPAMPSGIVATADANGWKSALGVEGLRAILKKRYSTDLGALAQKVEQEDLEKFLSEKSQLLKTEYIYTVENHAHITDEKFETAFDNVIKLDFFGWDAAMVRPTDEFPGMMIPVLRYKTLVNMMLFHKFEKKLEREKEGEDKDNTRNFTRALVFKVTYFLGGWQYAAISKWCNECLRVLYSENPGVRNMLATATQESIAAIVPKEGLGNASSVELMFTSSLLEVVRTPGIDASQVFKVYGHKRDAYYNPETGMIFDKEYFIAQFNNFVPSTPAEFNLNLCPMLCRTLEPGFSRVPSQDQRFRKCCSIYLSLFLKRKFSPDDFLLVAEGRSFAMRMTDANAVLDLGNFIENPEADTAFDREMWDPARNNLDTFIPPGLPAKPGSKPPYEISATKISALEDSAGFTAMQEEIVTDPKKLSIAIKWLRDFNWSLRQKTDAQAPKNILRYMSRAQPLIIAPDGKPYAGRHITKILLMRAVSRAEVNHGEAGLFVSDAVPVNRSTLSSAFKHLEGAAVKNKGFNNLPPEVPIALGKERTKMNKTEEKKWLSGLMTAVVEDLEYLDWGETDENGHPYAPITSVSKTGEIPIEDVDNTPEPPVASGAKITKQNVTNPYKPVVIVESKKARRHRVKKQGTFGNHTEHPKDRKRRDDKNPEEKEVEILSNVWENGEQDDEGGGGEGDEFDDMIWMDEDGIQ